MSLELNLELKSKLVSTSPPGGGVWVGGWTKTKLILISIKVEVVVEFEVELGRREMKSLERRSLF